MNSNFNLRSYVFSFVLRSMWSIAICIPCLVGLAIVLDDLTGNHYIYKHENKLFETLFFGGTLGLEIISILIFIVLHRKQRTLTDLSGIHQIDMQTSCFMILLRIGLPITLSLFVITNIHSVEYGDDRKIYRHIDDEIKIKEWNDIFKITCAILGMEVVYLLAYIYGIYNAPIDFTREL